MDRNTVLRLDAITGVLTLVAGNGTHGLSGDNGPATSAQLAFPKGVAVDSVGNVHAADPDDNRIRILTPAALTSQTPTADQVTLATAAPGLFAQN